MENSDQDSATSFLVDQLTMRWNLLPVKTLLPAFSLLAKGRPVNINELAATTNKRVSDIRDELRDAPVEWNEKEELVNVFGFQFDPTPHRLDFGGVITFCCCALWLHFLPRLVGKTAIVDSIDPVSRRLIQMVITPSGVESVRPSCATVTLANTNLEGVSTNIGEILCKHLRLFESDETASIWVAEDSKRFQVSLKTLDRVAQNMCTNIWFT